MITVGIITRNEEANIKECILSAGRITDKILIIDSLSDDRTVEIARSLNAEVILNEFRDFVTQKNLLIKKSRTEWIFVLDADERITDRLAEEIRKEIVNPSVNGFFIPRKSFYIDRYINHCGWYPDYVLKLFRTGMGSFAGNLVHETVQIKGNTKKLRNHLLHYPYKSISHHIRKINHYTDLYTIGNPAKKSSIARMLINPVYKFIKTYFLQFGVLDGKAGIILSIMASYYTFLKYLKIYERNRKKCNHN